MISINETKIELTTKILFENDFRDFKIVDVVKISKKLTTTNDSMTTSVLTTTYFDESSTREKFAKKFRFDITIAKLCLTKNFYEKIDIFVANRNTIKNFNRSKNDIVIFITSSYSRINSKTFSSFDKLRYLSNFDLYSRQRIKYFESRRLI